MQRRTFLRLAAAGAATALLPPRVAFAQEEVRDLVLVSNAGDGSDGPSVSAIDPATLAVVATLPLAGGFSFPATRWDFERDLIWAWGGDDAIVAYRLSTGERVVELPTGSSQNYTELTPDGRFLVASARFADRFLKIGADPDRDDFGSVVAEVATYPGASPCDVTLDPTGRYAYAPDRGGDTLTVLRVDPFERVAVVPLDPRGDAALEPYMATASPDGRHLLVENAVVRGGSPTGSESVFDLADRERPVEVARLGPDDGLGLGPLTSEIDPSGRWGVVICRDSSELSVIDLDARVVTERVALPEGSSPLVGTFAFGARAGGPDLLFVPLPGRDAVAAVTVPGFRIAATIPVGARPLGAVYLRAPLPERAALDLPLGAALAEGRRFSDGCPDPCCGPV